jgi:hypothetical protein
MAFLAAISFGLHLVEKSAYTNLWRKLAPAIGVDQFQHGQ